MFTDQVCLLKQLEPLVAEKGEDCPKGHDARPYQAPLLHEIGTLDSVQGGYGRQRDKGYGWCYIA